MKKLLITIAAIMFSTGANAFDLNGLVDKASQIGNTRSGSKRPWCRSLKTNTICEKTFYDMYCVNSDYDHPEISLVKEISVEGYLGVCVFEHQETENTGKYDEVYRVQMSCEIQRNKADGTYSCNWIGRDKKLIKKEKAKTTLGDEVMF